VGVRDVTLIIVYAIVVPLSFRQPFIGVLSWTWISYFNPQDFTYGISSRIPIGYLVAIPTLLGLLVTGQKQLPPRSSETGLLLLLWMWFFVTTGNVFISPELYHHWNDSLDYLWKVTKILLMVFVALALVTDAKRLRWWYLITAGSFAVFALKGSIFGLITGGEDRVYGPKNSMIYDNNDFGLAINMALPMFVALARTESSRVLRWCFWAAVPWGIMAVVLTYSRGDLLGLGVVLFALVMRSKRRWLALVGASMAGLAIFAAAPGKWIERMQTLRNVKTDESALARLHSWKFALRLFFDHPVFGGGFQTFTAPLYAHYHMLADKVQGPHSIYFQMLGEHGLPGLILFLGLIGSCLWSCRQARRTFEQSGDSSHLVSYVDMAELSLVAYLVSGAFLGQAYFDLFYQIVATVIILKKLARDESWTTESSKKIEELSVSPV